MNGEFEKSRKLYNAITNIDEKIIDSAMEEEKKRKIPMWKYFAAAACLCIVIFGAFMMFGEQDNTVQQWKDGYSAEEYFKFCNESGENAISDSAKNWDSLPYDESRSFSAERDTLEKSGVIPVIGTHPLFDLNVNYTSDGNVYSVSISWHRRDSDGVRNYSDLNVTVGYGEIEFINDCICEAVDENGNVVEDSVTVTERAGVKIIASGSENGDKTITFQNEYGWYQISGSWNDSYEQVTALLEYFWENPLDFDLFPMEKGDKYTSVTLADEPTAFVEMLPDFSEFGFILGENYVQLKNGEPVRFEGHYYKNVTEEQVKDGSFYDAAECVEVHWCIDMEPSVYDIQESMGNLNDITEQQVLNALSDGSKLVFEQSGGIITVYPDDANDAWQLIKSLQN